MSDYRIPQDVRTNGGVEGERIAEFRDPEGRKLILSACTPTYWEALDMVPEDHRQSVRLALVEGVDFNGGALYYGSNGDSGLVFHSDRNKIASNRQVEEYLSTCTPA